MLLGQEELDTTRAMEILQAVEESPHLYLTTGSACAAYEVIKDAVERGEF
jgi:hypothetical protein